MILYKIGDLLVNNYFTFNLSISKSVISYETGNILVN